MSQNFSFNKKNNNLEWKCMNPIEKPYVGQNLTHIGSQKKFRIYFLGHTRKVPYWYPSILGAE